MDSYVAGLNRRLKHLMSVKILMFIDIFENNIEKELEKVPNMKSVKEYSFYNYGVYVF